MITIDNYFDSIQSINVSELNETLQKGHDYLIRATDGGRNLDNYHSSASVKRVIGLYLEKLNATIAQPKKAPSRKTPKSPVKKKVKDPVSRPRKEKNTSRNIAEEKTVDSTTMVERIPEEIRFIRRFINLHEKTKSKDDLLRFINALQKSILEKRIRKTSLYAEQIKYIQGKLIETFNSMKGAMKMQLKPETLDTMKRIAGGEKVIPAINFIKRYIGMNGKTGIKEKARQLLAQIDRAYAKHKIKDGDAYTIELRQVKKNLQEFVDDKGVRTLEIEKTTLNGLRGVLSGCNCGGGLNGLGIVKASLPPVMNSMDFANVRFKTIGLKGKWRELIGDPSSNFTAMVFGKPKMGKSYLCVEFAGYLARNHGKVLYVAKEEGLDHTLQQKLNDKNVKHPNLDVASVLPDNLAPYDFIFLDSVNRLGLKPEDLRRLKALNPTKSFIYIFQSTKMGSFRGENSFQHDVDVVIEVPARGKAVAMGRFNQGGEINIFEDAASQTLEGIDGTPKKIRYPAWTTPKHLDNEDHLSLQHFYDLYHEGKLKEAEEYAYFECDTVIREEIPESIWLQFRAREKKKVFRKKRRAKGKK